MREMNPLRYLPFCLMQKRCLLIKWYPKTYKKYEISCGFHAFCLSLHKIVCLRQNEA